MKTGEEAVGVLLDALNQLEIDYMVVGSFSSNRYGVQGAAALDWDYMDSWCKEHGTTELLEEAKSLASVVW